MLVQFKVKNFRSIKDEQVFSMTCSSRNPFLFQSKHKSAPHLLPVAGIFGANASGKSTFTLALNLVSDLVSNSYKNKKETKLNVAPFLLDSQSKKHPSEFEISFIYSETLYKFGFTITEDRVVDEWLFIVPQEGRTNEVYTRYFNEETNDYDWNINDKIVKGPKANWKHLTNPKTLFLSVAIQYYSESPSEAANSTLMDAGEWLQYGIRVIGQDDSVHYTYTASRIHNNSEREKKALKLLNLVDKAITGLVVEENDLDEDRLNNIPLNMRPAFKFFNKYRLSITHSLNDKESITWDIKQESGGTKKFIELLGPILDVLEDGMVFIVDELHNNFHPHLLEAIIKLFQNKEINKFNAQLIFTSHDVTAMSPEILTAEQIWLVEKSKDHDTSIIPLSSYRPRSDTHFWKHYLAGRYNAIPNIGTLDDL
ncbi:MAG: ATP/GTP-binding protein [Pseudobdellovibrionaceae bacterium]